MARVVQHDQHHGAGTPTQARRHEQHAHARGIQPQEVTDEDRHELTIGAAEQTDDGSHEHEVENTGRAGDVAQPLGQVLVRRTYRDHAAFGMEQHERDEDGPVAHRVEEEHPPDADGGDERGRERGPDQRGAVEAPTVEADRARQILPPYQIWQQRLTRGTIEGEHAGGEEREAQDVPGLHQPGHGEGGEARRQQQGQGLRAIQHPRTRHPVGDHSTQ